MAEFHETRMGQKYYESTMPKLVKELERLNTLLEALIQEVRSLSRSKQREEARALYLSGEAETNADIATKLNVKPHTVGKWRKEEDWDGLRLKIDRRAAEMFVEKIATDRTNLNVLHFRCWELIFTRLMTAMKQPPRCWTSRTSSKRRAWSRRHRRVSAWRRVSQRRGRRRNRSGPSPRQRSGP